MNNRNINPFFHCILFIILACVSCKQEESSEYMQWHKVTIPFVGPETSESAEDNPFLNYRLQVTFTNGDKTYTVPGFYAADGDAGETSTASGNIWKVHFTPDETGEWTYEASFRKGNEIAVNENPNAGEPVAFDGKKGVFNVISSNKSGRDFRAKGRLDYVGKHYPQFAGSKEYFIKNGADSPENFLAYGEFDGTYAADTARNNIKTWEAHVKDWKEGDPTWQDDKGKGMVGAINYLASEGINSLYFITMNIRGDGNDVWPYTSHEERLRFDVSKLDQWERVFEHMDSLGVMLHVLTQETENETLLDGGDTGLERKLYYRELIARFGHHNALTWNLGEENGEDSGAPTSQNDAQRAAMADYFEAHDPYAHPVVIHTWPHHIHRKRVYEPLLGRKSFDGTSFQFSNNDTINVEVAAWLKASREAGHPWIANLDETGPASKGVMHDAAPDSNQDTLRHKALWGALMAGAAGAEWYFGYLNPHHDLSAEDYRPWDRWWDYTRYATEFFLQLPVVEMSPANGLVKGEGYGFAKDGEVYAFYFPSGENPEVKLPQGNYSIAWYDPRNGGDFQGMRDLEVSNELTALGQVPGEAGKDWVALVRKK